MPQKGLTAKIILLAITLLMVTSVVLAAMRSNITGDIEETAGGQTFLSQFVVSGGPIVWFVLLPMSMAVVSLAAEHCITIRRKKLVPGGIGRDIAGVIRQFGHSKSAVRLSGRKDFVSTAAARTADAVGGADDQAQIRNLFAESLQEQAFCLLRKTEWANTIGNVAPMVGLFGTVFGMIKAFNGIVAAGGQPQPAQLAGGISVALVTTLWGLMVAIPALAIHGIFRNRIETLVGEAAIEAEEVLCEMIVSLKSEGRRKNQIQSRQASEAENRKVRQEIRSYQRTDGTELKVRTQNPAGKSEQGL